MGFLSRIGSLVPRFSAPVRYYTVKDLGRSRTKTMAGIGEFKSTYSRLVKLFGEPAVSLTKKDVADTWGSKTAFEWFFHGTDESRFSISDYKGTNLYDDRLPSPQALKRSSKRITWKIYGEQDRDEGPFIRWLNEQLASSRSLPRARKPSKPAKPAKRATRARKGR